MPYNTLIQSPLQKLFSIEGWGQRNFHGGHYSIKFRVPKHHAPQVAQIKAKHPETIVHMATTGYILFGGTYSTQSRLLDDCKQLLKVKIKCLPK